MPFVVFEGLDGSGKSTLVQRVQRALEAAGMAPRILREPGSTPLGERIRELVLHHSSGEIPLWSEVSLFTAARAQLVSCEIRPVLEAGGWVLLDRYYYSTMAYQGHGSGADPQAIEALNLEATHGLRPDLVFLLDLSERDAMRRLGSQKDRMESRSSEYFRRVREGYLKIAEAEAERFCRLDATLSRAELGRRALARLNEAFGLELEA